MEQDELISKSQLKRDHHALQALGAKLVKLSEVQLSKLPLTERSREAIAAAYRLKHGPLQRQLRHLAHVLEDEDQEALRNTLAELEAPTQQASRRFHELERWRESLLSEGSPAIDKLLVMYSQIERARVSMLVHAAKSSLPREATQGARLLFKYLSENVK